MIYGNEKLKNPGKNRDFIDAFGGFNHNMRIRENEFYNIENMSSHHYPLLSSKKTFINEGTADEYIRRGICYNDEKVWYCYEDEGVLKLAFEDGETVYSICDIKEENLEAERQMINFGAYIIVMPDKVYFNTADVTDYGSMEKAFNNIDSAHHYNKWYIVKPCDADGKEFIANTYSATEPSSPSDGHVWYDLSEQVIKVWTASYSMWLTPTIYHKYRIEGIGEFEEGSAVKFICYRNNEKFASSTIIQKAYTSDATQWDGEFPATMADYIVIPSSDDTKIHWANWNSTGVLFNRWRTMISVEQKMPVTDYLCECQGRLWGCRYGNTEITELREYRKHYSTLPTGADYIDVFPELDNGEEFGEYLTYWAYDDNFVKLDETDGVYVTINTSFPGTPEHPVIEVTVDGYTNTLNVNVNYLVKKTEKLNEIYASKQQDFKCWDYFQGTALDSYTVNIGSSGRFTGCINFNGKPLFSKEDRIYILYGDYTPYKLQENIFEGVEYNAHKSMVVYNGVLYYKGIHGIYAYSGGLPSKISEALGDLKFSNSKTVTGRVKRRIYNPTTHMWYYAWVTYSYPMKTCCAAAYNGVYYINLTNNTYGGIYKYDIEKGIWHRGTTGETPIQLLSCVSKLYSLNLLVALGDLKSKLSKIEDDGLTTKYSSWLAETGVLGLGMADEKYCRKITVRYKGTATLFIEYDSSGTWEQVMTLEGGTKSKTFSMTSRRCDHFRLKFTGDGEFYLYSIAKTVEPGSDVNNGNV